VTEPIRLKLFARFADVFAADEVTLVLPSPVRLRAVRDELARLRPELAKLVSVSAFAVNEEYADDDFVVTSSDEVAIIPPVSGGEGRETAVPGLSSSNR
jgi:molybdopterin converting factor subunit 1